jgi:3-hydroxypropanoate dehydrogenase
MVQLPEDSLAQIFTGARTANSYLPQAVTADDLREIWDLAKWGPTSANTQPARVVWCLSQESRDRLADCASSSNGAKIRAAPAAAVVGMDLTFHERVNELYPAVDMRSIYLSMPEIIEETAFRNSTLQGAYLIIAARALGFDVGPMSGFAPAKVDEAFFAGTTVRSNFIMTLGRADPEGFRPRGKRLEFDEANRIL